MPNWCNTSYKVTGEKEKVEGLLSVLKELKAMPDPGLRENGFGSNWLGNVVIKMGGDPEEHFSRGEWFFDDDAVPIKEGVLSLTVLSAWQEMAAWRRFVEKAFSVRIYYLAEEMGNDIFVTNDRERRFFPDEWYLSYSSDESEDGESYDYYDSLESLLAAVGALTGKEGIGSVEESREALAEWEKGGSARSFRLVALSLEETPCNS